MTREPLALLQVVASTSYPGLVSLRPYPRDVARSIRERLTSAGFKPGDVVEVRISHITRISEDQGPPPPGQIRRRRGKR